MLLSAKLDSPFTSLHYAQAQRWHSMNQEKSFLMRMRGIQVTLSIITKSNSFIKIKNKIFIYIPFQIFN